MIKTALFILSLFVTNFFASANTNIIINSPLSSSDERYDYPYKVLVKIIEATPEFGEANVVRASTYMYRERALRELIKGELIHIMAEAPKPGWDKHLNVISIPIRKGIQGLRLFIINQKDQQTLQNIDTLSQFQLLPTGSGKGWSTRKVMEKAGFIVVTGSNYEGLFGMLARGRFKTFGRGVNEAFMEVDKMNSSYPELIVDSKLLLHIPLATYYYISPQYPKLTQRIRVGLQRLITTGEFDKIFYQNHCDSLVKSKLHLRKKFQITKPTSFP